MRRYLAFVSDRAENCQRWREPLRSLASALSFRLVELPAAILVVAGDTVDLTAEGKIYGAIVGSLFRRSEQRIVTQLDPAEMRAVSLSPDKALIAHYWGNYVALVAPFDRGPMLIRAPFGDLACYHQRCEGGLLAASDPDLLFQANGSRPEVDWDAIAMQLIAHDIRRPNTCLKGIAELAGGDCLSAAGRSSCRTVWTPWTFVSAERRCDDRERAAANIAEVVPRTVAAVTAQQKAVVLLLSGGLDSSIVAASLARSGRQATALTMVTHAPAGDERGYARTTAEHCAVPLREVVRDVAAVDIRHSSAAALPYPIDRSFSQATAAAAAAVALDVGADAVVHGGGGDNIFCALQSAAPLADFAAVHGLDRRAVTLTHDLAANARATNGAVMRQAAARLLWRSPRYRWSQKRDLLSPDAQAHAAGAIMHPWLDPPAGALPGSAGHIGLMLSALGVVQSPSAQSSLPWRAVLLNQPVVEACLSVPSWLWFERGCNRAIARRAFEPMLPKAITWRSSKGAMDSFVVELFEAHRSHVRAMMLDGDLARSGLIDRVEVARVLDSTGPVRGDGFGRVMQFVDVEAWLASWRTDRSMVGRRGA